MPVSPTLSVIIPVHNASKTLTRCVGSILDQTADFPIEVILVENGSTDDSADLCHALADKYPCVKAVDCTQTGVSEARNLGIRMASAPYVTFVDADDYVDPGMYEALIGCKERYGAAVAYCNFINEFPDGSVTHQFADTGSVTVKTAAEAAFDVLMNISTSAPWQKVFDRKFLDGRPFPEGVRYEDHAVIFRWMGEAGKAVHVDTPYYHYCHQADSYTSDATSNPTKLFDYLRAELLRLEFVMSYPEFSAAQRQAVLTMTVGQLVITMKRLAGLIPPASPLASRLEDARTVVTERLARIGAARLGFNYYMQYLRLRYGWISFCRKQRRKFRAIVTDGASI